MSLTSNKWLTLLFIVLVINKPCIPLSINSHTNNKNTGRNWKVARTINALETSLASNDGCYSSSVYDEMTHDVIVILKEWSTQYDGDDRWKSLLNKANLRQEVEESIVALHHLREWIRKRNSTESFLAVDICCGKGIFSMLLSYLATKHLDLSGLSRIILLDKDPTIDWAHVKAANATRHNRIAPDETIPSRPIMELWAGMNLHLYDSHIVSVLQSYDQPIALTGIHLCKTLSPAFVSLVNTLGAQQAPYVCLAPCCLPRFSSQLKIDQYESPLKRNMRLKAMQQRRASQGRRRSRCYVCQGQHHVDDCPQKVHYDDDLESWNAKVETAIKNAPCWNCGQVGHQKANCTEEKIKQMERPTELLTLSDVEKSDNPFESYCALLSKFIQGTIHVEVVDSGLTSPKDHSLSTNAQKENWNRCRKNLFIVASR